jgi:hypothetical protein
MGTSFLEDAALPSPNPIAHVPEESESGGLPPNQPPGASLAPPVNANVNVHLKMLLFPAPQKFNTFNTFNTFDPVASRLRIQHSVGGKTPNRLVNRSETNAPALVDHLTRSKPLTDSPTLAHAILLPCELSRASGADFS